MLNKKVGLVPEYKQLYPILSRDFYGIQPYKFIRNVMCGEN